MISSQVVSGTLDAGRAWHPAPLHQLNEQLMTAAAEAREVAVKHMLAVRDVAVSLHDPAYLERLTIMLPDPEFRCGHDRSEGFTSNEMRFYVEYDVPLVCSRLDERYPVAAGNYLVMTGEDFVSTN